jgi:glucose/arabinose dehydrogenase
MIRMQVRRAVLPAVVLSSAVLAHPGPAQEVSLSPTGAERSRIAALQLPDGFRIEFYARVPGARSLALGPGGTVFVGTRGEGRVYAVVDEDQDGRADRARVVAEGLDSPNGVAYRDGDLFVAEISRVLRFPGIGGGTGDIPRHEVLYDGYPGDRLHGWKFIRFGPDGLLYVPVGAPCNICNPGEPYASITRLDPRGGGTAAPGTPQIFARGIRNTVGFDWNPDTGVLWFTDNGRDWLGDDRPPDELNRAPVAGLHFGFPYLHGRDIPDPQFGDERPGGLTIQPPALELGPHVAALGMRFYTGTMFPPEFRNRIFIAEHGSWNRSRKIGYRVVAVTLRGPQVTQTEVFAEGWLDPRTNQAWGRPVDLEIMPDGALLLSDDETGILYRISWVGDRAGRAP